MPFARGMLSMFDGLTDRLLCVSGAVLFSQAPEFMQQYLQRLGGHLDEARRQLASFQQTAHQAGLTLEAFTRKTAANPDADVARLGGVMNDTLERVVSLQTAHDALLQASLWERPLVFVRYFDAAIARATGAAYQPAMPTTIEGFAYAVTGMLLFLALYHLGVKRLLAFFVRPRTPVRAQA